jgi:molybdate transport system substrate-binding protein
VLSKVALGEADAGFVYSTDAKTVPGKVNVLKVPAWAQPKVTYEMAIVSASPNKTAAQQYINEVLGKAGQKKMLAAGFLPIAKAKSGY